MDSIQFKSRNWIRSPKDVHLSDGYLVWTAESGECSDPFSDHLEHYNIEGCLESFIDLADATADDVFAFVQRYGPLGIAPVNIGDELLEDGVSRITYCESVIVYQRLAKRSRSILAVMQALRSGKPVDQTAFLNCIPVWEQSELKAEIEAGIKRRGIHRVLLKEASRWSSTASYKFLLSPLVFAPNSEEIANPYFTLDLGSWENGSNWDDNSMPYFLDINPLIEGFEHIQNPLFEDFRTYPDLLPSILQRPSPLFNALAFHFTRKLTLPEGYDWCDQCNEIKEQDGNRNKRRPDKDNWYCSDECADAARLARSRVRDKARKKK